MDIRKVTLDAHLESPVKLLLTADNHLSYADEREDEVFRDHAYYRNEGMFSLGEDKWALKRRFDDICAYAKENCDALVMAGDVIDHHAKKNMQIFRECVDGMNFVYATGNHDYNCYAFESESPELLDARTPIMSSALGFAPYNTSKRVGGVNIVAISDVFERFDESAIRFVKDELRRDMPTLLVFHIPLYADTLIDKVVEVWKAPLLTGCPDEVCREFSDHLKMTDENTKEMLRIIAEEKNIIGTLAGHVHFEHEDILPCGKTQIICRAGAFSGATEIEIV